MRFLFVDRILQFIPGEVSRGIKHVTLDDSYLCRHKDGRLGFMPSLIGEMLGQLAAWNVMAFHDFKLRPVAGVVASAKFLRPAYVGETLLLESFIERLDESAVLYHSIARIKDKMIFNIEGALGPLLPMNDYINEADVRQQYEEINRPGNWPPDNLFSQEQLLRPAVEPKSSILTFSFDRFVSFEPGVCLTAEKRVTRTAPYFPDHFPKKPVLPMTVLLECKLNLAREFIELSGFDVHYEVSELLKVKMNEFIQPGDSVLCHLKVKEQNEQHLILNYRSEVNGKRVCVLDMVMTARRGNGEE
jgi:3-hydroxymyristoyl/3-hydroxydecanoyl-(acyl carrier protein) dehydratase